MCSLMNVYVGIPVGLLLLVWVLHIFNEFAGPWICEGCWKTEFIEERGGEIMRCKSCSKVYVTSLAEY